VLEETIAKIAAKQAIEEGAEGAARQLSLQSICRLDTRRKPLRARSEAYWMGIQLYRFLLSCRCPRHHGVYCIFRQCLLAGAVVGPAKSGTGNCIVGRMNTVPSVFAAGRIDGIRHAWTTNSVTSEASSCSLRPHILLAVHAASLSS
jgi:hypothetical protein